jgi:hypothetical protein
MVEFHCEDRAAGGKSHTARKRFEAAAAFTRASPVEPVACLLLSGESSANILKMSDTPDYAALVRLFHILRTLVDACGDLTLTADEAAQIRLLGFRAEEGRWRVPPVPFELVAGNPLLEHLSLGWNPAQAEAAPNGANTRNQSCEVAQIIEGNGRSVLAATKAEGIGQPLNISEQKADLQATAANRILPAPAKAIRQDSELTVPSQQTANEQDRPSPRRRRTGYQLPRTPEEQDRMAEEAASKIVETLQRAGKLVSKRRLQQLLWRYPATIVNSALTVLARQGRISLETR